MMYSLFAGGFDEIDRSDFKEISDAAMTRLESAKATFDTFLKEVELKGQKAVTKDHLLTPDVHLVDACWKLFSKHVKAQGCIAHRIKATEEEKKTYKQTRKGPVYFVNVKIPTVAVNRLQAARGFAVAVAAPAVAAPVPVPTAALAEEPVGEKKRKEVDDASVNGGGNNNNNNNKKKQRKVLQSIGNQ